MLKESWERFCQLYVENGGNASQAYIEAGVGDTDGQSLSSCASRLLKKADIQIRISQIRSKHHSKYKIDQEVILDRLCKIVFEGNSVAEIDENGELKLIPNADIDEVDGLTYSKSEMSSSTTSAKGSKNETNSSSVNFSIRNRDKLKALDMLCKILGIYERRETTNSGNFNGNSARVIEALRKLRKSDESSKDSGE